MNFVTALLTCVLLQGSEPSAPGGAAAESQPVHWAIQLGLRVTAVERRLPVVDRVVLVPDAATCLDEISRWTLNERWPVLIEDAVYAPMFIRRFRPAEVVRVPSVGEAPAGPELHNAVDRAVASAWGGTAPREAFAAVRHTPPGIVIASAGDPAWIAAAALAAGRGQPVHWLEKDFGKPDSIMAPEKFAELRNDIDGALRSSGYGYAALGDEIDAITLCRRLAGRVAPTDAKAPLAGQVIDAQNPIAMTDAIGRKDVGERYAFVGWVLGDDVRSTYMSMCSLFLSRSTVVFVNGYALDGGWAHYDVLEPAKVLQGKAYEVETFRASQVSKAAWASWIGGGVARDVIAVNTAGNADFFDLAGERLSFLDVPVLNEPAAVHFTHSWSAQRPEDPATLAQRWLEHGAYVYVGSVHEPLLAAFVPPVGLVDRWSNLVPFIVAARHWEGPFSRPWRVNTFGDPLMVAPPPNLVAPPRTAPAAPRGEDLRKRAAELVRATQTDQKGDATAEAIVAVTLLGEETIAISLWRNAVSRGIADLAARPALGPLFRQRDVDGFVDAFSRIGSPSAIERDMLWHLVLPRLNSSAARSTLLLLESNVRTPRVDVDAGRLLPHLVRGLGADHASTWVNRLARETTDASARRQLEELARGLSAR